ncbi:zinc-finger homeodomain protein 14-like [Carica papaya]|uniref:zinc-finger homeodomain protein 14-like n=1 Tax=Carica papaya TaxID=3649 RepID=UPI000B8C9D55|nr:zinc-finger homeodomain protein 14-like [Carica papaya]
MERDLEMERELYNEPVTPNHGWKLNYIQIDDDDDDEGCHDYLSSETRQEYCANCGFHRNYHFSVVFDELQNGAPGGDGDYDINLLRAAWMLTLLSMHGTPPFEPEAIRRRSADSKKNKRSKFSEEQKDSMREFAESLGWTLKDRSRSAEVGAFCEEIGISKFVFKTWVNNNKKFYGASGSTSRAR